MPGDMDKAYEGAFKDSRFYSSHIFCAIALGGGVWAAISGKDPLGVALVISAEIIAAAWVLTAWIKRG